MYDSGKIIAGLVIFVVLITFPVWYNNLIGDVEAIPAVTDTELSEAMFQGITFPNDAKHALSTAEMRSTHMQMLETIHAKAMADGYTPEKDGKKKSMQCMMCHGTKEKFCDSCHVHAAVETTDCWSCHDK
ncbi:MAG: cytochrome C [Candidatus Electrothrix sp. ATG2]|nr:cytochrome C [Candidatus Electrothrix sp. ATG2]